MDAGTGCGTEVELWDVKDVCRVLKVKKSWVYAHADSGELPSCRIFGLLRFDPRDVLACVAGCKSKPARVVSIKREKGSTNGEQEQ